jgi:hypothetical protein
VNKPTLLLGMLVVLGCMPVRRDGTGIKSLDNYARGDGAAVHWNHCGMDLESLPSAPLALKAHLSQIITYSDDLKKETLSALTAVPEALTKPFFAAGGTIELTPNAPDVCADVPLSPAERRFAGEATKEVKTCWRQDAPGKPPVIYVQAEAATIRHGLVRAFAFLYSELFVSRLDAMIAAKQLVDPTATKLAADYRSRTEAIGAALLADMKKAPAVLARLKEYQRQDAAQFARVATAEALDGYFCAPATQLAFRQGFPLTYRAFVGKDHKGLAALFGTPWFQ